jgi:hypothetical protein
VPVEVEEVEDLTPAHATTGKQLRELQAAARAIEREYRAAVQGKGGPALPDDLTNEERAKLGMQDRNDRSEVEDASPAQAEDDYSDMDPEVLSVIETLMGKRPYVPPGSVRD